MIKEKIKQKKGITLISVIVSIILLLILSTIVIYSSRSSNNVSPYNNMKADINLLEDKILIYYNKYNEIPTTRRTIQINNAITYSEIDLSKLENITLRYGQEYGGVDTLLIDTSDVYVVNGNLEVYYLKGAELDNVKYYEN
ncbi:MAG: hypothetical protein Q4G09_01530 [Clostridia bacterium]|nr:hypothetical protein [Clostridia bacterium]